MADKDGSGSESRRHQPRPQAPADRRWPFLICRRECSPPAFADLTDDDLVLRLDLNEHGNDALVLFIVDFVHSVQY